MKVPTKPSDDVAAIAGRLHPADRACLLEAEHDPHCVRGSVASLMTLCLEGLADPQPDSSIKLNKLGLAVRNHLLTLPESGE